MVNFKRPTVVMVLACTSCLYAQVSPDFERRLADLENRMRQIDPAFQLSATPDTLEARLSKLEATFSALLAKQQPTPQTLALTAPVTKVIPTSMPPPSANEETRLPVAGYMDFHVNKDRGEPFRPDFHRFVLLFGHSFSNRIKFWSELEVEHALVEGRAQVGRLVGRQALLGDVLFEALARAGDPPLDLAAEPLERDPAPRFRMLRRPGLGGVDLR